MREKNQYTSHPVSYRPLSQPLIYCLTIKTIARLCATNTHTRLTLPTIIFMRHRELSLIYNLWLSIIYMLQKLFYYLRIEQTSNIQMVKHPKGQRTRRANRHTHSPPSWILNVNFKFRIRELSKLGDKLKCSGFKVWPRRGPRPCRRFVIAINTFLYKTV